MSVKSNPSTACHALGSNSSETMRQSLTDLSLGPLRPLLLGLAQAQAVFEAEPAVRREVVLAVLEELAQALQVLHVLADVLGLVAEVSAGLLGRDLGQEEHAQQHVAAQDPGRLDLGDPVAQLGQARLGDRVLLA